MSKYFNVDDNTVHHLKRVLRIRIGDVFIFCDDKQMDHQCVVTSLEPFAYEIIQSEKCQTELSCRISLYQAVPKADKLEWIVQKAVELGAYEIVPIYTEHCDVRSLSEIKHTRMQKIAESAAGQSMRGIIPQVILPMDFSYALERAKPSSSLQIVAHEKATQAFAKPNLHENISIWIGPEGGFSHNEIESFVKCGFQIVNLGSRILRTETAAIAILAAITIGR